MKEVKNDYVNSRILSRSPEGYAIEYSDEENSWITPEWEAQTSFLEGHYVKKEVLTMLREQVASEALQKFARKKEEDYRKSGDIKDLTKTIDLMGKSAALTIDSSRLYELAELLEEAGRSSDSKEIYAQFLEEFPNWIEGYRQSVKELNQEAADILITKAENMRKIADNRLNYLNNQ